MKPKRVKPAAVRKKKVITWQLRLYVAGKSEKSTRAFENLYRVCEENLPGQYKIEVIDLLQHPRLARGDQIIAIPTLVRRLPTPMKRLIGDLSDTQGLLVGLDLRPVTRRSERT